MVDLAKIRKKAKKSGAPPTPAVPAGEVADAPPEKGEQRTTGGERMPEVAPEEKLQRFLSEAGRKRPGLMQAPVETASDQVEMLAFILGGEQYAIDIDRVAEIITARPATRVPNADPSIVGIISLRGSIVTLVDVRSKLRQPAPNAVGDARIVVLREGAGLLGFEVDRVLRPAKIARAAIDPQPVVHPTEQSEAIRGVVRGENTLTIVLDLDKLLR